MNNFHQYENEFKETLGEVKNNFYGVIREHKSKWQNHVKYHLYFEQIKYTDVEFANAMLASFNSESLDWQYEQEVHCVILNNGAYTKGYYHDLYTLKRFFKK